MKRFKSTQATVFALVLLVMGTATTARAQFGAPVYSNIPNTINPGTVPLNVFSQGEESSSFNEMGDGLSLGLTIPGPYLDQVTVYLDSWACTSGSWQYGPGTGKACVTTPGATYSMPVTLNVYSVTTGTSVEGVNNVPAPNTLIATSTQTFAMPYRPSSDFVNCPAAQTQADGSTPTTGYYEWFDAGSQTCNDGILFPITFNLFPLAVVAPSQVIVTVSYNTTHFGPAPIGTTACNATVAGCFYDSLNVTGGANAGPFPGAIFAPAVGSVLNVPGIFTRYPNVANAQCGTGVAAEANKLALDSSPGCYTGEHPMIEVTVQY